MNNLIIKKPLSVFRQKAVLHVWKIRLLRNSVIMGPEQKFLLVLINCLLRTIL